MSQVMIKGARGVRVLDRKIVIIRVLNYTCFKFPLAGTGHTLLGPGRIFCDSDVFRIMNALRTRKLRVRVFRKRDTTTS